VIAGRTRFYVVAGITGAIAGEALAAAVLIGVAQLADLGQVGRRVPDLVLASALALVVVGGAARHAGSQPGPFRNLPGRVPSLAVGFRTTGARTPSS